MPVVTETRTEELLAFIEERYGIYRRKTAGEPKPWTDDPILQQYRFCNMHREDDRVTKWIAEHWRNPKRHYSHLWFTMLVARLFNNIDTLAALPVPLGRWDQGAAKQRVHELAESQRVFNPAYIVSTNGVAMDKIDYVFDRVIAPAWQQRNEVAPQSGDRLATAYQRLQRLNGVSGFIGGQIIADLKYAPLLRAADDWDTWAASGPGSRRGLNRLLERPTDASWVESQWLWELLNVYTELEPMLRAAEVPSLHAQDLQNCLCEWDKYERTRLGEGKPKQKYPGV